MERTQYWKNVLTYNKSQTTVLILEKLSEEEIKFIENNKLVRFLVVNQDNDLNSNNVLYVRESYSPDNLKNINYCFYRGNDKNVLFPVLSSGISIIDDLSKIGEQTSLERIDNFELATSVV